MAGGRELPTIDVWRGRWGTEELTKEEAANPRMFARGFRQQPFTDEERWFPSFTKCFTRGIVLGDIQRRGMPAFVGVDLSSERRPGNCIFVACQDDSGLRYVVDIKSGAWTSPELADRILSLETLYNIRAVLVENNGYQQSLIDWIKKSAPNSKLKWKIHPHTTGANKSHPERGVRGLEIEFNNKGWVVPEIAWAGHDMGCQCGWCVWKRDMADYPQVAYGDEVMAMWFCREGIEQFGWKNRTINLGDVNAT